MKLRCSLFCATFLVVVFMPEVFAQRSPSQPVLYRIAEVGTFGGPNSRL